jgi:membrane protein
MLAIKLMKSFFMQTQVGLFLYILVKRFFDEGCTYRSASLVYTTLLGIIPFFFISITLLSWLPGYHASQNALVSWLAPILTPDQLQQVNLFLQDFLKRIAYLSWFNIIFLAISCVLMVYSMACALDAIWRTHQPRSWMKSLSVYIVTVILGPLSIGTITILWAIIKHWPTISFFQQIHWLVSLGDTIVPYIVMAILLTIFNKVLPSGKVPWLAALLGSACTVCMVILIKWIFLAIIVRGPTYEILYGNLALFPLMMLWIYAIWVTVLLGALIGYTIANGLSLESLKRLAKES